MHPSLTRIVRRLLLLMASAAWAALVAGCGGSSSGAVAATTSPTEAPAPASSAVDDDEDHDEDDEDHSDDEDHDEDDDGEDHSDDDDEDHDEDHSDEDDEDHDDDHSDEDDEDHDDEGSSGGLDAHIHGSAELFVAWSGNDVVVDLISPANNVFGFEYEPTTDEDQAIVAERTAALTAPDMLVFNAEAACSLAGDADSIFTVEGSHAEVATYWLFTCDEPDELSQLDLTAVFAEFPGFEDVDVQWASEDGQSAAELSPSSSVLRFD